MKIMGYPHPFLFQQTDLCQESCLQCFIMPALVPEYRDRKISEHNSKYYAGDQDRMIYCGFKGIHKLANPKNRFVNKLI